MASFRVEIETEALLKIEHWVGSTEKECSGLGKLLVEDGAVKILDAILLPQKNTYSNTELDGESIAKAMYELKDRPGDLRFWWHSHGDGKVFWSQTDVDTMRQLAANGWVIATVFNRKGERRTALAMGKPFSLLLDELPLEIAKPKVTKETVDLWDKEFQDKVKAFEKKDATRNYDSWRSRKNRHGGNFVSHRDPNAWEWFDDKTGRYVDLYPAKATWEKMSKRERREVANLRIMRSRSYGLDPCLICGWTACVCPQDKRKAARVKAELGICWECDEKMEVCACGTKSVAPKKTGVITSASNPQNPSGTSQAV